MLSGQLLPDGLVLRAGHQSLPIEETTFGATSDIHNSVKPHFSEVGGGEDLTERPYVGWLGQEWLEPCCSLIIPTLQHAK